MIKSSYLSKVFRRSPNLTLQQHMQKVSECVSELIPLFDGVVESNPGVIEKAYRLIAGKEQEADKLKKALRMNLPKNLLLPIPRRDILELIRVQDKIANKAKDIAGLIVGRQMRFPTNIHPTLKEFVIRCVEAVHHTQTCINELDELVEMGFRGREVARVETLLEELDSIESDTDEMQVNLRTILFRNEQDLPPVDVMFMYKIFEWVGDIADDAERVGRRLQLTLAK